jgi:hypothetical protein
VHYGVVRSLEKCGFVVETTDRYGEARLLPRRIGFIARRATAGAAVVADGFTPSRPRRLR